MEIDRREIGSNQPRVIRQCGNCQGFRKWKRHFEIGFPTNHSDEFSIFRASHNPVSHRGWVNSSNIHRFSLSLYPAFTNRVLQSCFISERIKRNYKRARPLLSQFIPNRVPNRVFTDTPFDNIFD